MGGVGERVRSMWFLTSSTKRWKDVEIVKCLIVKLVAFVDHVSDKQIARELGSSSTLYGTQTHALLRKAEVSSRTELALRVAAAT